MPTLRVDTGRLRPADLAPAAEWIRQGGIAALPTETFYGLAVDPQCRAAVAALFELKGRQAQSALPLVAASLEQVEALCGPLPDGARQLARRFWPGPLSLVLDVRIDLRAGLAPLVAAGDRSVAIRVPGHEIPRVLAAHVGRPLTATSANRSGEAPARSARALAWLAADSRVLVIDAGDSPGELPSTIIDARVWPPRLVREGAVPWSRVLESPDR
ncbi:MAG TPA: L-threonylcarbamoyladenylate synthase [Vicinamibacterales bacterium]|nr:L-threonylcarbamoyladenylate synthase [Vicinamibacterales bacterium]